MTSPARPSVQRNRKFLRDARRFRANFTARSRAVAQLGRALEWGSRGPGFKSRQPDFFHAKLILPFNPEDPALPSSASKCPASDSADLRRIKMTNPQCSSEAASARKSFLLHVTTRAVSKKS